MSQYLCTWDCISTVTSQTIWQSQTDFQRDCGPAKSCKCASNACGHFLRKLRKVLTKRTLHHIFESAKGNFTIWDNKTKTWYHIKDRVKCRKNGFQMASKCIKIYLTDTRFVKFPLFCSIVMSFLSRTFLDILVSSNIRLQTIYNKLQVWLSVHY